MPSHTLQYLSTKHLMYKDLDAKDITYEETLDDYSSSDYVVSLNDPKPKTK